MKKKILILAFILFLVTGCTINNPSRFLNKKDEPTTTKQTTTKKKDNNLPAVDMELNVGETVKVKNEYFYVLEKSDKTQGAVVLISKYNLTKDGSKQAPNAKRDDYAVEFSSSAYWIDAASSYKDWDNVKFNVNDLTGYVVGDAMYKVNEYAKKLGAVSGRLITYEEVESLRNDYPIMIGGQENKAEETNAEYLDYYTASVRSFNLEKVYMVRGEHYPTLEVDSALYGVRPVITISKKYVEKI